MPYLLDTNIVSDMVRNPSGRAGTAFLQAPDGDLCTSIVVAAELRFAVVKGGSKRLAERVEEILAELPTLPLQSPVDEFYAALRAGLDRSGTPIGQNDMLIAAHALSLGYVLVTGNEREFCRVKGLRIENWLK